MKNFKALRQNVIDQRRMYENAVRELEDAEISCQHQWGEPAWCGQHVESKYIPGDKEMGREMGVDSRPGFHTNAYTIDKWKRVCSICGKEQETNRTESVTTVIKKPKF